MEAGLTSRVTVSPQGTEPNGPSSWPALSGDGRYVAFVSNATNLVPDDGNGRADVFLHETATGRTEIVSHRADGRVGTGPSARPVVSFDGQTVAFQSLASDLTCGSRCGTTDGDINLLWDVFVTTDQPTRWCAPAPTRVASGWNQAARRRSMRRAQ